MYTYERKVTYSDVAWDGCVDAAQIVRYFQDCSTMQSDALGVGIDFLEQHQHVWMLTAWQIDFKRRPRLGENVVTGTWAYGFDAMYGYRNFILKGAGKEGSDDGIYAVANSIWVLIDMKSGRPSKLTPEDVEGYGTEEKYAMDYEPRRIRLPKVMEDKEAFYVTRSDLDTNRHVNNARYISMALEYLEDEEDIRQLRVEYKRSAVYGDRICPRVHREPGVVTVALCSRDGQVYVTVEMKLYDNTTTV